jgi:hypothetical protein
MYFEPQGTNPVVTTQIAFGIFTLLVAFGGIAATYIPRWFGHALAATFGTLAFICAVFAILGGFPGALSGALLVLGVAMPALAWLSLKGNRAAWAFLTVICGVLGVCLLFGAPKVRSIFGVGLWSAMILPGLLAVTTIALGALRHQYQTASADPRVSA